MQERVYTQAGDGLGVVLMNGAAALPDARTLSLDPVVLLRQAVPSVPVGEGLVRELGEVDLVFLRGDLGPR